MKFPDGSLLYEHALAPGHRGPWPTATHHATAVKPACGDEVTLHLEIGSTGHVEHARFEGRGCAVSQGAASLFCECVEGLSVTDLQLLLPADALQWLEVDLSPLRQSCALVAFRALRQIVELHFDPSRSSSTSLSP